MKNYQALAHNFVIAVPEQTKTDLIIPESVEQDMKEGEFHEILSISKNAAESTGLVEGDQVMINFKQGRNSIVPFKLDGKFYFSIESFSLIGKKVEEVIEETKKPANE